MKLREYLEARAIAQAVLDELQTAVRDQAQTQAAAFLRNQCARVISEMKVSMKSFDFAIGFNTCFHLAILAGAMADDFFRIRKLADRLVAKYPIGATVRVNAIRFTLIAECKAISLSELGTKSRCDALQGRLNSDFDAAIVTAADRMEYAAQRALVKLHAAITADLVTRGRPLPNIATFETRQRMPALALANRIYGDADRAQEIIAENAVVHPLFMPTSIKVLTA